MGLAIEKKMLSISIDDKTGGIDFDLTALNKYIQVHKSRFQVILTFLGIVIENIGNVGK